ncbi:MAG: hypothetical protein ACXWC8_08450 [Limisphaerales bacterium]
MTEEEKQAKIAQLKKVPKPVQLAVLVGLALGLVTLVRMPLAAYAMHLSVGKGIFHGLLMLSWFFVSGVSLYTRSRWGYVGLVAVAVLPLLGVFALSIHLLRLTVEGTLAASWADTTHSAVAALQLITTIILFRYLLARQVLSYVWKPIA